MSIEQIETNDEYRAALKEIERLMGAAHDTSEGQRLDELAKQVEVYDATYYPLKSRSTWADRSCRNELLTHEQLRK